MQVNTKEPKQVCVFCFYVYATLLCAFQVRVLFLCFLREPNMFLICFFFGVLYVFVLVSRTDYGLSYHLSG